MTKSEKRHRNILFQFNVTHSKQNIKKTQGLKKRGKIEQEVKYEEEDVVIHIPLFDSDLVNDLLVKPHFSFNSKTLSLIFCLIEPIL